MDRRDGQYSGTRGLSMAIVLGVALGTLIGRLMDNMNTGLTIGLVAGVCVWLLFNKRQPAQKPPEAQGQEEKTERGENGKEY